MVLSNTPWFMDTPAHSWNNGLLKKACLAELVLGVTSKRCIGNGICSIYTKGTLTKERAFCHFAEIEILADSFHNLLFKLNLKSMRSSSIKKYFNKMEFIMEEDFLLPDFINIQLSIPRKTIEKGCYLTFCFDQTQFIFFPAKS